MRRYFYFLSVVFAVLLATSQVVQAQCGASLSSCKTCHEVKREKPVATQGQWHQQHAFGDFCEFCHGGNTAAKDKASAHEGINTMPIKDAGNTCSSCHPDDYAERAQKYAAILKVDLGNISSAAAAPSQPETTPEASEPETATPSSTTIAVPSGGEVVDFNQLLTEKEHAPRTYGNLILVVLIIGFFGVFLLLYWSFNKEKLMQKIKEIAKKPAPEKEPPSEHSIKECKRALEIYPEIKEITACLIEMDQTTIASLAVIIKQKSAGEEMLRALSHVDLDLVARLRALKSDERDVVLALATKI